MEKELLPEVNRIMNSNTCIFIQDSAPSHCANIVQDFLKKKLGKGLLSTHNGPHHRQIVILLTITSGTKEKKKCMKTDLTNLLETQTNWKVMSQKFGLK